MAHEQGEQAGMDALGPYPANHVRREVIQALAAGGDGQRGVGLPHGRNSKGKKMAGWKFDFLPASRSLLQGNTSDRC